MKNLTLIGMLWIVLAITFNLSSCDNLIDYSPYDTDVQRTNLNGENISTIEAAPPPADSLLIVVISDTHSIHTKLKDAIRHINQMRGISFVVINGDITNWGLAKEYKDFHRDITQLKIPFITVIGNHDYLSNGGKIFKRMFGEVNFSFHAGNQKVVVFDNVVWEKGNRSPDFNWLEANLPSGNNQPSLLFTHIHIWDPQLGNGYADRMREIIEKSKVQLCVFGHGSNYQFKIENKVSYLVVPKIATQMLTKITVTGDTAIHEIIKF